MKKNKLLARIEGSLTALASAGVMTVLPAFATGGGTDPNGTTTIDAFLKFALAWIIKIGATVALIGGVMFALAWQREDAEGKSRGLMTMMAGFMLAALGAAPSMFGLDFS